MNKPLLLVVTVNYRLGIFGFYYHDDPAALLRVPLLFGTNADEGPDFCGSGTVEAYPYQEQGDFFVEKCPCWNKFRAGNRTQRQDPGSDPKAVRKDGSL